MAAVRMQSTPSVSSESGSWTSAEADDCAQASLQISKQDDLNSAVLAASSAALASSSTANHTHDPEQDDEEEDRAGELEQLMQMLQLQVIGQLAQDKHGLDGDSLLSMAQHALELVAQEQALLAETSAEVKGPALLALRALTYGCITARYVVQVTVVKSN
jgi:hypothetical protein